MRKLSIVRVDCPVLVATLVAGVPRDSPHEDARIGRGAEEVDPMLYWLMHTRIEVPTKLVPIDVLTALLAVALLVSGRRRRLALRLAVVAGAAAAGYLACWVVGDLLDVFGVTLTAVVRMWVAVAFAGVALAVTAVVEGGWWRRAAGAGLAGLALVAAVLGVNVDFAAYPTLITAVSDNPYPPLHLADEHGAGPAGAPVRVVSPASWRPPASLPRSGEIGSVWIRGAVSHFPARRAVVYLPPAALVPDPPVLPVILSLSGQPGAPGDMFSAGSLGTVLDSYARDHHGLAPIVVAADQLALPGHNPMCVDSAKLGNAATYIMTDVVGWIRAHLAVPSSGAGWGILGFSEGATCAMQFSAAHPGSFSETLAVASELQPMNGDLGNTVSAAFGGSVARYESSTPLALLRRNAPFHNHLTVLAYGQRDSQYRKWALELARASRAAGMRTLVVESPRSSHDWNTVAYALRHAIPLMADHAGLGG